MNRRGRGGRQREEKTLRGRFNSRYVPRGAPAPPPPALEPAPVFAEPRIVGYMSVDGDRRYHCDLSQLRYVGRVTNGPVRLDLNHNLHTAVKRSTEDNVEKIDLMLQFMLDKGSYLDLSEEFTIVCYRRTLLQVMCKAWPGFEPVRVAATLLDGTIYLCSIQSEAEANQRKTWNEREMTMCAWGYKFEQYMTSDVPNKPPDTSQPVVENAEFSLYYSTRFGSHRLVYGAQIDGLIATEHSPPPPDAGFEQCLQYLRQQSYAELKTNRIISNRHQEYNFKRRKLLYCWGQCFVTRLKGLIVGFRDDAGVVTHVTCYDTPHIAQYCQEEWTPSDALSFLDHFLCRVQDHMRGEVRGRGGRGAVSAPISALFYVDTDSERTISVSECESILPQWYIDGRTQAITPQTNRT